MAIPSTAKVGMGVEDDPFNLVPQNFYNGTSPATSAKVRIYYHPKDDHSYNLMTASSKHADVMAVGLFTLSTGNRELIIEENQVDKPDKAK